MRRMFTNVRLILLGMAAVVLGAIALSACGSSSPPTANAALAGPNLITNLHATVNGSTVSLTWTNPANTARDLVFRGPKEIEDSAHVISAWTDNNVPIGTYTYQVVPIGSTATLGVTVGPAPTTTTTTTAPPPTSTTTTTVVPQTNCITGNGQLGPYFDPNIWFSNGNGTTTVVKNQNTGANAGTTETLCDPNKSAENWTVAANAQGRTNVQYYPDLQEVLTTAKVQPEGGQGQELSGFSTLSSTFNTSDPGDANGVWESAYDLWFGNRVGDIMIWEDTSTALSSSSYGGAHVVNSNVTIAGQSFTLIESCNTPTTCAPTTDEVMLVHNTTQTSGTENMLADIQYLQANGYVPTATNLAEANFGFEVRGTAGTTENFALNSYSLTQTPAS